VLDLCFQYFVYVKGFTDRDTLMATRIFSCPLEFELNRVRHGYTMWPFAVLPGGSGPVLLPM
jgi:hypothetical protein